MVGKVDISLQTGVSILALLAMSWTNVFADYVDANNEVYQSLDYIAATGSQWIVTDIRPTCTDTVKMKFRLTSTSKTQALYCSRTTMTTNTFTAFLMNSGLVRCDRNTNTSTTGNTGPNVIGDTTFEADYHARRFSVNGIEQDALMADGDYTPGSPLMLFASHTKGDALSADIVPKDVDNKATYRLYWFELYSHGSQSPKHRLVPALRESDSVAGLYDTVGGKFYSPADNSADLVPSLRITHVKARQRYPGGGIVDISYEVVGNLAAVRQNLGTPSLWVTATNRTDGTYHEANIAALSGDTGMEEGVHHVAWDMSLQGVEFQSSDVVFSVAYVAPPLYCVIDLSAGANAASYPVSYLPDVPEGGWTDEYKTTKLVLRRIWPGVIPTRDAATTKSYYIGVFEVTQRQYELVMETRPSYFNDASLYATRPVEQVSYNMIRGSSNGAKWPSSSAVDSSSFMGKVRSKTGINEFDLPTEAMWEYACRAGTTTDYNSGKNCSDSAMDEVGSYAGNGNVTRKVGSYQPNTWGLYDMHGNVSEWCLDWYGGAISGNDPVGPSSGTYRVLRGGSWAHGAGDCTSSTRKRISPSDTGHVRGFRLVRNRPNGDNESDSGETVWARQSGIVLCDGGSAFVEIDSRPVVGVIGDNTWFCCHIDESVRIVRSEIGQIDSVLSIPETLDNKGVVSIGANAFTDCRDIEAVTIPASVAEIGDFAFAGCSNLSQVTLSGDIGTLTVGGNAFGAATAVTIGNKSGYEFVGWTNTAGRVISDPFHSASAVTVTPVWQRTETITIDGRTWTVIVSEDGHAMIGNGTDVAVDPAPVGDLAIPEEIGGHPVMGIGSQAFTGCEELTGITIPGNVTSVGYGAFEGCTGLTNVVIETESIDCVMPGLMQAKFDTQFDILSTLDDANEVANVSGVIAAYTKVTESPWEFTDPLTNRAYAWNETNTTFAYFGQMYMDAGKTYVFGTHFDDNAYIKVGSNVLLNVDTESDKTKICSGYINCADSAWHDVEFRLGDISGGKGSWGNIWSADFGAGYRDDGSTDTAQGGWSRLLDPGDGSLFRCDGSRTIFAGCSNIVSVTMPWSLVSRMSSMFPDAYDKLEAVTLTGETDTIPEKAFAGCESLRTIAIPDGIEKIGESAFLDCGSLEELRIPSGRVIVEDGAFSGCTGVRSVVLPLDISRCGLVQAKFDTYFDLTSSIVDSSTRANVSGVLMGYAFDTKTATETFSDPVYGGSYKWNTSYTTFGYSGYMYMVSGKTYVFGKYFDDAARVVIDGTEVLRHEIHKDFATGSFVPDFTGWHPLDVRVSDNTGTKGPQGGDSRYASPSFWSVDMGVGWRDDAETNALPESGWNKLTDPGDGSLFRVEARMTLRELLPDSYTQVTNVILDVGFGRKIPENCLAGCESLTGVTIPAEIDGIGSGAFGGCTSLANMMLPNGIGTLSLGANVCSGTTTVEIEPMDDYFFGGWTNEAGVVVSAPFHSATAVTVSPWWRKVVDLSFDANGGTGEMAAQTVLEGDALVLASNAFVRVGYLFLGWSVTANGDVVCVDGATIPDVSADMDGATFYAVWKPNAPGITPANDTMFVHASETIALSHVARDVVILYTTDGSDPTEYGREYKGSFAVYNSCTVRATAYGAGRYSDEVSISLTRTERLSEAVNLYGYLMETDSSNPWTVVTDVSHDGISCARSGAIGNGGLTWLQTSVRKAGTVSFWWKAACEEAEEEGGKTYWYDYGSFFVDGVEKAAIAGNDTGWRKVVVDVPTGGKHVLRWEYRKDGATSYPPDCVWLDQVQWVPADGSGCTLTTPEPVPYSWLEGYRLGLDSDFEAAANAPSGKADGSGRALRVWEEYVAGTDPTDARSRLVADIALENNRPKVTWNPDLNTNGVVRAYKVWGREALDDGGGWQYPTNALHRFFKVTVEMP